MSKKVAVAVYHSRAPGRRLARHYRSPPLAVASARSPIHVAVAVSHSRAPGRDLYSILVKKQQALDKKGVEKIAKSALSPQTKPKTSTGMLSHIQF
nr:protein MRG1 [Ipomoea batatas]